MNESLQDVQKPTESENATLLWIVWEMTKQTSQATKASKLQKEFADNLHAVFDIWQNRNNTSDEESDEEDVAINGIPDVVHEPKKKKRRPFAKK
jgi:hypothetical protein